MTAYSSNSRKLAVAKTVHDITYILMVLATFYVLFAAITKTYNVLLHASLILLTIEGIVFAISGMKCPLTTLAKRYGDPKGYAGDRFFSEQSSKYLFRFFGLVGFGGLLVLLLDILKLR